MSDCKATTTQSAPRSVLVLGGTGFAGRNIIQLLKQRGIAYASASRAEGCDLRDTRQTRDLLAACQPQVILNCVAHVGSLNYVTEQAATVAVDNLRLMLAMYESIAAEAPNCFVVNPIANCAYPAIATMTTFEEDKWWDGQLHRSVLSYGSTRRMLWALAECYQMQYDLRSINLLVPNMYGPHDSTDPNKAHALNALIAKFVKAKAEGNDAITIWGTGIAVREWLYVGDFSRVILDVITTPNRIGLSEPINIAQNFGLSVRELVDVIADATAFAGKVVYDPTKPDGAPRKVMDDRRFKKVFPCFEFTSLKDGIAATIEHYRARLPY